LNAAEKAWLERIESKLDALLARGQPQTDRDEDEVLVKLLHDAFDTDEFTRRDIIERSAISPPITKALLNCDVDPAEPDTAEHYLKYALRRMKGTRVGELHLWNDGNGIGSSCRRT
jgi:hypothetical protein